MPFFYGIDRKLYAESRILNPRKVERKIFQSVNEKFHEPRRIECITEIYSSDIIGFPLRIHFLDVNIIGFFSGRALLGYTKFVTHYS
jgi:hypothetical protein